MPKVIKPITLLHECLLGFCFNNIFCAATILVASTVFFAHSRNEEMMGGDGFLVLLLPVCFEQ